MITVESDRLKFDSETHRYTLDGKPLMGVTEAIGKAFSGLLGERNYDDVSRQRGSAIHHAIMLASEGTLDEATIHPVVRPYYEAFRKFVEIEKPETYCHELRLFDEQHRFAGCLDWFGVLRGASAYKLASDRFFVVDLTDWKSGHLPWTVGMQTAAYSRMLRPMLSAMTDRHIIIRRWSLNLRDDATYKLDEVSKWPDANHHEADFLAAVRVARLRTEHAPKETWDEQPAF